MWGIGGYRTCPGQPPLVGIIRLSPSNGSNFVATDLAKPTLPVRNLRMPQPIGQRIGMPDDQNRSM